MDPNFVMVRHGQSEWNLKNLFTGWKNPDLTEQGVKEAVATGKTLKESGFSFDLCFTSELVRAQHTLDLILKEMDLSHLPIIEHQALNERDYGDLTGLNKADAAKEWGEEQILQWRRSYDIPPPNGESLKTTGDRTVPYFKSNILPKILNGQKILVAAHGNSIRSLIKHIENLTPEEILNREVATGEPVIYKLDSKGEPV